MMNLQPHAQGGGTTMPSTLSPQPKPANKPVGNPQAAYANIFANNKPPAMAPRPPMREVGNAMGNAMGQMAPRSPMQQQIGNHLGVQAPPTFRGGPMNGMPAPRQAMAVPVNPAISNPFKPGPMPPVRGRAMQPQGKQGRLNWQQMKMRSMPPGMRQMYNGRPMTAPPNMNYSPAPPTRRGQPVGSRVNLMRNQFGS